MWCNKTQGGTSLVTVRVPLSRETTRHMTVRRERKRLCSAEDDFKKMRPLSSSSLWGTVQRADFTSRQIKAPCARRWRFCEKTTVSFRRCQATGGKTSSPFLEKPPFCNGDVCAWKRRAENPRLWTHLTGYTTALHVNVGVMSWYSIVMFAMCYWWQSQNFRHGCTFLKTGFVLFQRSLLLHLAGRSFTSFPESCCPSLVWLGWEWTQTGSTCVCASPSVVLSTCVCICSVC